MGKKNLIDISDRDFNVTGVPHGWIQWKGTDVCIDIHCQCGHLSHYDGDFLYFVECPQCHAKYAVGQNVKLITITDEEAKDWDVKLATDE